MPEESKSLAERILTKRDAVIEKCHIPEWGAEGDDVYLRLMTGAQRDAWETEMFLRKSQSMEYALENAKARLAVRCLCNGHGELLFTPAQAEELGRMSSTALTRIWDHATKLNKLRKEDVDALVKN